MRILGQITKLIFEKSRAEDPPSFEEICKAGKLMGLDPQDIIRLSEVSKSARIKSLVSKHPFIFVLIAAFAYLILLLVALASLSQIELHNTYPAGTRYGAISIRDFRRGGYLSRMRNNMRWKLVRVK